MSPYGLGAVLSHKIGEVEKPVLFISCTFSSAEKNYSQKHREALAIIFAVHKFHNYLYGNFFTLQTDQKALTEIFHPAKGTSSVAA